MNVGYVNSEVAKMYGIPYSQLTAQQKRILKADSQRRATLIAEREQAVLKNGLKAFADEAKMEKVLVSIYSDCQKGILASVQETIAKVQKAGGTWSYANASALTRSKGLFEQITQELTKLGQKEQSVFYSGLGEIYTDQFLRQVYTLGQSINVSANFNRLNAALVKKTLDYPWSGAMFSDRLWNDKATLGRNLRVGLTQSMVLGESIPEITERIKKGIDTSQYNAERVARTEVKRVTYCAHDDVYADTGVDYLRYRCANGGDGRGCSYCMADNDKVYKRGEEPTLPRHPNCRCIYIPEVEDEFKPNELNELTESTRAAENYEKWLEDNADKINPDGSLKDGWIRDWENGGILVNTSQNSEANADNVIQGLIETNIETYRASLVQSRQAIQSELSTVVADYDAVVAQRASYSTVRRGLVTAEDAGFASRAEYEALEKQLAAQEVALKAKREELERKLKTAYSLETDCDLDILYMLNAEDKQYVLDHLDEFRSVRTSMRLNESFDMDAYMAEWVKEVVPNMDADALIINSKLSTITEGNAYSSKGTGWYSPAKKKVEMDMSSNAHEKALGNGLTGSWQTKYHEEGHQLDHLLSAVDEITGDKEFSTVWAFTSHYTDTGKKIRAALEKDLGAFLQTAIDYCNAHEGTAYKAFTGFGKISSSTKYAYTRYINHITANLTDRKMKCKLGILSDAMGLFTQDRISAHGNGLWGHNASYNKNRGKDGAASETWATFCAIRGAGTEEEKSFVQSIMPETWGVMDGVYHELAVYLLTHGLSY